MIVGWLLWHPDYGLFIVEFHYESGRLYDIVASDPARGCVVHIPDTHRAVVELPFSRSPVVVDGKQSDEFLDTLEEAVRESTLLAEVTIPPEWQG